MSSNYEAPYLDIGANVNACVDTFMCRSMLTNINDVSRVVVSAAFESDTVVTQQGEYYLHNEKLPIDIIPRMNGSAISVGCLCGGAQSKEICVIFTKDECVIANLLMIVLLYGIVGITGPFNETVGKDMTIGDYTKVLIIVAIKRYNVKSV